MTTDTLSRESERLKLALKTFIMRRADRDLKTDQTRLVQILAVIDRTIGEIAAERAGLVERVAQTVNQPENVSRKILSHPAMPPTMPLSEFRLAEERLGQLARQTQKLEAARALLQPAAPIETNLAR